jgi:hypothetical protein
MNLQICNFSFTWKHGLRKLWGQKNCQKFPKQTAHVAEITLRINIYLTKKNHISFACKVSQSK